jgi:hypothetical protein
MYGRIEIRIRETYFYGGHMDLVWYGRKGMKMKTKGIMDHSLGVL